MSSLKKKTQAMDSGWKYYNHAMLPRCKPYEQADISIFSTKGLWKKPLWKDAYFAKWTTEYDCGVELPWYWVVCDTVFNYTTLKSKLRNEMKKAIDNFDVRIIEPENYVDELYEVKRDALLSYPKSYRNVPTKEDFVKTIPTFKKPTFAAFCRSDGKLAGYINMVEREDIIHYSGQHVIKDYERLYVNYALIIKMLEHYRSKIESGAVIVDGERNINHITKHQDLLIKKFGFRKAYCKLNIKYRPIIRLVVKLLYPFRRIIRRMDSVSMIHKINGVLLFEQIAREQKHIEKRLKVLT